jgi:hypothetical protein
VKNSPLRFTTLAILPIFLAAAPLAQATTFIWTAGSGTDLFWGTSANWSASPGPGPFDTALFNNTAVTNAPGVGAADNVLAASRTIQTLQLTNTTGNHNVLINSGVTLTISNSATVDSLFDGGGVNLAITNTISGAGGKLFITNLSGNINLREGSGTTGSTVQRATLDLSGLDTLNAYLGRLLVAGDGGSAASVSRESATLYLAKTNVIQASSSTVPAVNVGDNASNGAGGNTDPTTLTSYVYLGQTNAFFADTMTIGREKCAGAMFFNPAFTNSGTPVVYIRGPAHPAWRLLRWAIRP